MLEPHTREQIELGQDVAEQLRSGGSDSSSAIRGAIDALISRDNSWKEAHRGRMAGIGKRPGVWGTLTAGGGAAMSERDAWNEAKARNHQRAVDVLQGVINDPSIHPLQRAELMFRAAGYLYRVDQSRAAAFYQKAFHINSSLPRPTEIADKKYSRIR